MALSDWNVRKGALGVLNTEIKHEGNSSYETPEEESLITHSHFDANKLSEAKTSVWFYANAGKTFGIAFKVQDDNTCLIIALNT